MPEDKKKQNEMTEEEKDREERGVQLGVYMSYVKNELEQEHACMELPFTIILLLTFSALSLLHLRQDWVYTVENALKFDIVENANFAWAHNFGHKSIGDVNSVSDFWAWFRLGFLPLIVQHSWGYSESLQDGYNMVNASHPYDSSMLPGYWGLEDYPNTLPVRNDLLHYNRIIGGIRLTQERGLIGYEYCRMPRNIPEELWREWLGKPCLPGTLDYELSPEVTDAETFTEMRRTEWFMTSMHELQALQKKSIDMEDGCSHMQDKLTPEMRASGLTEAVCLCETCNEEAEGEIVPMGPWVDEMTQRIEIGFVIYNADYGVYTLVTCNFFFNRGGAIHELVHTQSAFQNVFSGSFLEVAVMVLCDITWVSMLSWVLYGEVREVLKIVQSSKERWYLSLWREYVAFYNCVDWISIGCAYLVVVMYFRLFLATQLVNEQFEIIGSASIESKELLQEMFERVEEMSAVERGYRMSFMFYPIVVMMRLFKSFDAQPRLAVVTCTIQTSIPDMSHFFIVFTFVYFCFSMNAVLIFGQDVEDFANVERAVVATFRALFGDWDYSSMKRIGLALSAVWFWCFVVIMCVLLLNMLLAILMEAYTEVKEQAASALTLATQVSEIARRRRQTKLGERVRLNDIWDAYFKQMGDERDMLSSTEIVTPEDVQERVFESLRLTVPKTQAKRTVNNAKKANQPREESFTAENIRTKLTVLEQRSKLVEGEVTDMCRLINKHDRDEYINDEHPPHFEVEHRKKVASTVQGVIGGLRDELRETLGKERDLFEASHRESHVQLQEMFDVAKDAEVTLQGLRDRTEQVVGVLQRHAVLQRASVHEAGASSVVAGIAGGMRPPFMSCAEPVMAPK